jgi:hypothetical protein
MEAARASLKGSRVEVGGTTRLVADIHPAQARSVSRTSDKKPASSISMKSDLRYSESYSIEALTPSPIRVSATLADFEKRV